MKNKDIDKVLQNMTVTLQQLTNQANEIGAKPEEQVTASFMFFCITHLKLLAELVKRLPEPNEEEDETEAN